MREAIGGSWLFGIVVLFIALFTSYLAYSISYTRAFNLKNQIITEIERQEGFTKADASIANSLDNISLETLRDDDSVEAQALYMIKKAGYNYTSASKVRCDTVDGHVDPTPQAGGYCVTKYCQTGRLGTTSDSISPDVYEHYRVYYKVTTFIAVTIPVVNITLKVPITGETKTLYYDKGEVLCDVMITD